MLLKVENLRVSYGKIKALHGINFNIDVGEIVTIIGANGAVKAQPCGPFPEWSRWRSVRP